MLLFDCPLSCRKVCTVIWLCMAVLLLVWQGCFRSRAELARQLTDRLGSRLRYRLTAEEKQWFCVIFLAGTVVLAALGLGSGFCCLGLPPSFLGAVGQLCINFLFPGFFEELLFRGLLIRPPAGSQLDERLVHTDTTSAGSSNKEPGLVLVVFELMWALVTFLVYHLDAVHPQPLFRDLWFLLMALVLGLSCQAALLWTRSLWPGVLMHWLWVWGWLNFGGGLQLFLLNSGIDGTEDVHVPRSNHLLMCRP